MIAKFALLTSVSRAGRSAVKRNSLLRVLLPFLVAGLLSPLGCARRGGEVQLVGILPLTGELAEFGTDEQRGMDLAVAEINKRGGVGGKRLLVRYEDSRSDARTAVAALQRVLAGTRVPVVFSLGSTISLALAPVVDRERVVMIAVASTPDLTGKSSFVFRNFPVATAHARKLAEFAFLTLGLKEMAVLHINDDLGYGNSTAFVAAYQGLGGRVLWVDAYPKDGRDFRGLAAKLARSNLPAAYIPGYGDALALLVRQIRELGYRGRILSSLEFGYPNVLTLAGPAGEGVGFADLAFAADSDDPAVQSFVERFRARYQRAPTLDAVLAYDGLRLAALTMQHAGLEPAAIRDALRATKGFQGVTGSISVRPDGDFDFSVVIKVIKDGKPQRLVVAGR